MKKKQVEKIIGEQYAEKVIEINHVRYISVNDIAQIVESIIINEKSGKTEYWQDLVHHYWELYEKKYKFGVKPDFRGSNSRDFKEIINKLKALAIELDAEWTHDVAISSLEWLLDLAHKEKWLRENFLLSNINKQFQKLVGNERTRRVKSEGRNSNDNVNDRFGHWGQGGK